jgi:hypothetical protein
MRRKTGAVVVALLATQLLSGCYLLRELDWSQDKVDGGESSTASIGTVGTNATEKGRVFVLGFFETEGFKLTGAKWDTGEVLGGTKDLVRDDALLELAGQDESCFGGVPIRGGAGPSTRLFRTNGLVKETSKFVDASLKAKAPPGNAGDAMVGIAAMGLWIDDGDDVPEDPDSSDDEISCTGSSTTAVLKKGSSQMAHGGFFDAMRSALAGE